MGDVIFNIICTVRLLIFRKSATHPGHSTELENSIVTLLRRYAFGEGCPILNKTGNVSTRYIPC